MSDRFYILDGSTPLPISTGEVTTIPHDAQAEADLQLTNEGYKLNLKIPKGTPGPRGATGSGSAGPQGPQGIQGEQGASAGFGNITTKVTHVSSEDDVYVKVVPDEGSPNSAKNFEIEVGVPPALKGESAGFGDPVVNVQTLSPGSLATVDVQVLADSPDSAKIFSFNFGIPEGSGFKPDATGVEADRAKHDNERVGFVFLATDTGIVYVKQELGWSDGFSIGVQPELGAMKVQVTEISEVTTESANYTYLDVTSGG